MNHWIPAKKLYQKLNLDEFNQEKTMFFRLFYPLTLTTVRAKWDFLIEQYLLRDDVDFKEAFRRAMSLRKEVPPGDTYLSLEQYMFFLENFYFFLSTQDPRFSLNAEQKLKLINKLCLLSDPENPICEPGIVTYLHEMMIEFISDTQWIPIELYRQRQNHLVVLAERYNQQHQVRHAYSIHTLKRMQQFAYHFPLGLGPEIDIEDIHLSADSISKMDEFFRTHYLQQFKEYEQNFIQGLYAELWRVFQSNYANRLTQINGKVYFRDEVSVVNGQVQVVKSNNTRIFQEFLIYYLGQEVGCSAFYNIEEDEDASISLVEPELFKQALYEALVEKLRIEQYILEPMTLENPELIHFLAPNSALASALTRFFAQRHQHNLKQHALVLQTFPQLLVPLLFKNPNLWYSLPKKFINQEVVEYMIFYIDNHFVDHFNIFIRRIHHLNESYLRYFKKVDVSAYYYSRIGLAAGKYNWFQARQAHAEPQELLYSPVDIYHSVYRRFINELASLDSLWAPGQFLEWKKTKLAQMIALDSSDKDWLGRFHLKQITDKALVIQSLNESHHPMDALLKFQNKVLCRDLRFSKHSQLLKSSVELIFWIYWALFLDEFLSNYTEDYLSSSRLVLFLFLALGVFNIIMCVRLRDLIDIKYYFPIFCNSVLWIYISIFDLRSAACLGMSGIFFWVLPLCLSQLSLLTPFPIEMNDIVSVIAPVVSNALNYGVLGIIRNSRDILMNLRYNSMSFIESMVLWLCPTRLSFTQSQQATPFGKLGDDIYALQTSSNPAMAKKGELLLEIWHSIARDLGRGQSLESLLDKPYPVTDGYVSFNQAKQHPHQQPKRFSLFFTADTRLVSTQGLSLT